MCSLLVLDHTALDSSCGVGSGAGLGAGQAAVDLYNSLFLPDTCCCVITFQEAAGAARCLQKMDKTTIDGRLISVINLSGMVRRSHNEEIAVNITRTSIDPGGKTAAILEPEPEPVPEDFAVDDFLNSLL